MLYLCTANEKQISCKLTENTQAKIAQLVERNLAKVEVAGSNPVFRSFYVYHKGSDGGIGRHAGLKIQWAAMPVRVQVPLRVRLKQSLLSNESNDFLLLRNL